MLLVQIVRVPPNGVEEFQRFEALVLPLLVNHGGSLDGRLRTDDGTVEIHVVTFPSSEALSSYRADPERVRHLHLLEGSGAVAELIEMVDIGKQSGSGETS